MRDQQFFDELKEFWNVHEMIKKEEDGECSDQSKRGYREFLALAYKFEE